MKKCLYSSYSNETFNIISLESVLEYKEYFTHLLLLSWANSEKFRYSSFSRYELQNVWPSGEKYTIGLVCVML